MYCLYGKSRNFQQIQTVASHCAPSLMGDWWRKRGASFKENWVFYKHFFLIILQNVHMV